jgi:outer membrane protein assembly factor BamC
MFRARLAVHGLLVIGLAASVAGCGINQAIEDRTRVDYKSSAQRLPPLDIPPDLISPKGDTRFSLPAQSEAERTATGFERSRAAKAPVKSDKVLPLPANATVRMERSGGQRWLVTSLNPDELWPLLREFWIESGFILQSESPEIGIMETDWAENRAKIQQDFIRRALGRMLDSLYSTGERDKFRTRIDRGGDGTEIFITHRGMVEVYASAAEDSTVWQPRPSDPELEIEFLRKLMVKISGEQSVSDSRPAPVAVRPDRDVRLFAQGAEPRLEIADGFDRAWRRVGVALDRGGFTVDDRDRSKGLYFIRYMDPEAKARQDSSRPGVFGRMFGGKKEESISQQFRLVVAGAGATTRVTVLDREGKAPTGIDLTTASRILTLLDAQMAP